MWEKLPKWAITGLCIIVGFVSLYAVFEAIIGKPVKMYGFEFNQEIKHDTLYKIRITDTCIDKFPIIKDIKGTIDSLKTEQFNKTRENKIAVQLLRDTIKIILQDREFNYERKP